MRGEGCYILQSRFVQADVEGDGSEGGRASKQATTADGTDLPDLWRGASSGSWEADACFRLPLEAGVTTCLDSERKVQCSSRAPGRLLHVASSVLQSRGTNGGSSINRCTSFGNPVDAGASGPMEAKRDVAASPSGATWLARSMRIGNITRMALILSLLCRWRSAQTLLVFD